MNEHLQGRQHHALEVLHDAGAHLVICKRDKEPIWNGWQRRMPPLDVVQEHDGPLGIIPYSIGSSALDVDIGDWRKLPRPWVNYRTRRKGGRHLFYGDDIARGNSTWAAEDCSGEVRGAKGYLILWKDGAERLAGAITGARQLELFPFPDHLLEWEGASSDLVVPATTISDHPQKSTELELVPKGARQMSLFDVLRMEAYEAIGRYRDAYRGTLDGWKRFMQCQAKAHRVRFPIPLEEHRAYSTSYAVATWTWSKYWNHSRGLQVERGIKSGAARRKAKADRDRAIIRAVQAGRSLRGVGREFGMDHKAISWILKRGGE